MGITNHSQQHSHFSRYHHNSLPRNPVSCISSRTRPYPSRSPSTFSMIPHEQGAFLTRIVAFVIVLYSFGASEIGVPGERSTASQRSLTQERMIACWTLATATASAKPGSPCLPVTTEYKKL